MKTFEQISAFFKLIIEMFKHIGWKQYLLNLLWTILYVVSIFILINGDVCLFVNGHIIFGVLLSILTILVIFALPIGLFLRRKIYRNK